MLDAVSRLSYTASLPLTYCAFGHGNYYKMSDRYHPQAIFLSFLALTQVTTCQDINTQPVAKVLKLQWTTDQTSPGDPLTLGTFGPDGPWQALPGVMNRHESTATINTTAVSALWPSPWTNISEVMWRSFDVALEAQTTFSTGRYNRLTISSSYFEESRTSRTGDWVPDWDMSIPDIAGNSVRFFHVKAPVAAIQYASISFPAVEGWSFVEDDVEGTLALAPPDKPGSESIIAQLKDSGVVDCNSFGLHMGSPKWNQSGSFTLGGYDAARVMGEVATFDLMEDIDAFEFASWQRYLPRIYLIDVSLGWERGSGPFLKDETFQGKTKSVLAPIPTSLNSTARRQGDQRDNLRDNVMVVPDPTFPFLYLPPGTCEKAAKHLPVHWDEGLKLWFWDDETSQSNDYHYRRLVNSSAYMSFTLRSNRGRYPEREDFPPSQTITIKVPFHLLDFYIEPPLVWSGVQRRRFWPCRSVIPTEGYWKLGRAFLQAAFLGVNYDKNLVYLAQGIGPDPNLPSELTVIRPGDEYISGNPNFLYRNAEDYYQTWASYGKVLEDRRPDQGTPSSPGPESSQTSSLGRGGTIGLTVGATIGALLVFWLVFGTTIEKRWRKIARRDGGDAGAGVELGGSDSTVTTQGPAHDVRDAVSPGLPRPPTYKERDQNESPPPYRP